MNGNNDLPAAAVVAVFAEVDALPGTEVEAAVRDGDAQRRPEQDALDVRGHVVVSFVGVDVVGLVVGDVGEEALHVRSDGRVGVFVDAERRAGVFQKEVGEPRLNARLGDGFLDGFGNEVESPRVRW